MKTRVPCWLLAGLAAALSSDTASSLQQIQYSQYPLPFNIPPSAHSQSTPIPLSPSLSTPTSMLPTSPQELLPATITTPTLLSSSIPSSPPPSSHQLFARQGAPVTAPATAATVAVPMPTITTYNIWGGPMSVYTQVFTPFPDPWPAPAAGSVGLGTIQGTVGLVSKSKKRRAAVETGLAGPAPTWRIRGRVVS